MTFISISLLSDCHNKIEVQSGYDVTLWALLPEASLASGLMDTAR